METMFCWQVKEKTKIGTCGRRAVRCERRLACRQAEKEEAEVKEGVGVEAVTVGERE